MKSIITLALICCSLAVVGQGIRGTVRDAKGNPLEGAMVILDAGSNTVSTAKSGKFEILDITDGDQKIAIFLYGFETQEVVVSVPQTSSIDIVMTELLEQLEEVVISDQDGSEFGVRRLNGVEGLAIYEAKKSEVILTDLIVGNVAASNARQVYAKVPGLNIWENDGAGLQLGIGGRGLSPNRTSNFNVRQNGYDISADALGYPESYYTPPTLGVQRIELIRGAASLQYGTQFGGLLNFKMKEGPEDDVFQWESRTTGGTYGFLNAFNSIGGQVGDLNYYAYYDYNQTNGWRPNSESAKHTGFSRINYDLSDKLNIGFEYTYNSYLAQQAGGLTDRQFEAEPRQSNRARNWFAVDWNLFAHSLQYSFNPTFKVDYRLFHLSAGRDALGNLGDINRPDDPESNRELISDDYNNWGLETRLLKDHALFGKQNMLLLGARVYKGETIQKQGYANNGSGPDFDFLGEDFIRADYTLPGFNFSLFAENVINLNDQMSLTPGIRYERIITEAEGYYKMIPSGFSGDLLVGNVPKIYEDQHLDRDFVLLGLGYSYRRNELSEIYANFSQNYRSVTFGDIRINNASQRVDENIKDERGFNVDLGFRTTTPLHNLDVSFFGLSYQDKIGFYSTRIQVPLPGDSSRTYSDDVRIRTNVGDALIGGLELFYETNVLKLLGARTNSSLNFFINLAVLHSAYTNDYRSDLTNSNLSFEGNQVELVPAVNLKSGLTYKIGNFKTGIQLALISEQYTDAANTELPTANAVEGKIPTYYVMDWTAEYQLGKISLTSGVNNLTNNMYYTRRAAGYPGPGIIPSDGISAFFGIGWKL